LESELESELVLRTGWELESESGLELELVLALVWALVLAWGSE